MASVNKVILVGNLGSDPEFRTTQSGQPVATFSIATTRRIRDQKSDTWNEQTDWHRVVLWQRQAEIANQYLKKGSSVYIEGRLQTREYVDRDNVKRYITEVVGETIQLLGGRPAQQGEGQNQGGFKPRNEEKNNVVAAAPAPTAAAAQAVDGLGEEDIPF